MGSMRAQYGPANVPFSLATVLAALISAFGILGFVAVVLPQ
jgi:hypothetical protein